MPEPITTIGVGAIAAYLGKDGLQKILGPTADYLGIGLREFAQKRVETIGRIFCKAEDRLGAKLEQAGQVPPKVLKQILDEGSFANDDLAVEYLGGILASSRTEHGRDDRGARIAKLVDRLSTYQLRTHYLIYASIRSIFANHGLSLALGDRRKMRIFIPFQAYAAAMDFSEPEIAQFSSLVTHIFFGLHAESLIEGQFEFGPQTGMIKFYPQAQDGGIMCQPSALGVELFLWAFGESAQDINYLFDPAFNPTVDQLAPMTIGASPIDPPPPPKA